ncbi:hypothetical protein ACHQM5_019782 [Ranunculus cassubicifolius]
MNNNPLPNEVPTNRFNGISYLFVIPVAVVLFLGISALLAYCHRGTTQHSVGSRENQRVEVGLDETMLQSYPRLLYSQAKVENEENISSCCSICLSDYTDADMLRLLPDCGHAFHLKCVDPWLRLHPTCPVCRKSHIPTPISTPLSEDVPLPHNLV